jgi:hypothetical protein
MSFPIYLLQCCYLFYIIVEAFACRLKARLLDCHLRGESFMTDKTPSHHEHPFVQLVEDICPNSDLEFPTTLDLEKANYDYFLRTLMASDVNPDIWVHNFFWKYLLYAKENNLSSFKKTWCKCQLCDERYSEWNRQSNYWPRWLGDAPEHVDTFRDSLRLIGAPVGSWDIAVGDTAHVRYSCLLSDIF